MIQPHSRFSIEERRISVRPRPLFDWLPPFLVLLASVFFFFGLIWPARFPDSSVAGIIKLTLFFCVCCVAPFVWFTSMLVKPYRITFDASDQSIRQKTIFGSSFLMSFSDVADIVPVQTRGFLDKTFYFKLVRRGDSPGKGLKISVPFCFPKNERAWSNRKLFEAFRREFLPALRQLMADSPTVVKSATPAELRYFRPTPCGYSFPGWKFFLPSRLLSLAIGGGGLFGVACYAYYRNVLAQHLSLLVTLSGILVWDILSSRRAFKVVYSSTQRSVSVFDRPRHIAHSAAIEDIAYFKVTRVCTWSCAVTTITLHFHDVEKGFVLAEFRKTAKWDAFIQECQTILGPEAKNIPVYYSDIPGAPRPVEDFSEVLSKS